MSGSQPKSRWSPILKWFLAGLVVGAFLALMGSGHLYPDTYFGAFYGAIIGLMIGAVHAAISWLLVKPPD
jgi:uncharacterized membrane protein YczE